MERTRRPHSRLYALGPLLYAHSVESSPPHTRYYASCTGRPHASCISTSPRPHHVPTSPQHVPTSPRIWLHHTPHASAYRVLLRPRRARPIRATIAVAAVAAVSSAGARAHSVSTNGVGTSNDTDSIIRIQGQRAPQGVKGTGRQGQRASGLEISVSTARRHRHSISTQGTERQRNSVRRGATARRRSAGYRAAHRTHTHKHTHTHTHTHTQTHTVGAARDTVECRAAVPAPVRRRAGHRA
jgi:hypothetical protein